MAKYDYTKDEEFDRIKIETNLNDFFERDPKKFLERVAKGPPPCY
jgi:hypothetical protein